MSKEGPFARRQGGDPGGYSLPDSVATGRVVSGTIERIALSLPSGVYAGVPGIPELGGGIAVNGKAGPSELPAISTMADGLLAPALLSVQKITADGPVRAIAIAADSAIAYADLWLGDFTSQNRFRLAPGRPWIGDITRYDHVWVTLPEPLNDPWDDDDNTDTTTQWTASNVVWEAGQTTAGAAIPGGRVEVTVPLRLEVYRGDIVPMDINRRGPLVADFGTALDTVNTPAAIYGQIHIPVQGRAETRVIAQCYAPGAAPTNGARIQISGVDPVLMRFVIGQTRRLLRFGVTTLLDDVTLTPGKSQRFVYPQGFAWLKVKVLPVGANTVAQAAVHIVSRDS